MSTKASSHHRFFQYVTGIGPGVVPRNMLFLFAIVVLPYASRLVGEKGHTQVGAVVYAASVSAVGLTLLLLLSHIRRSGTPERGHAAPVPGGAEMTRRVLVSSPAYLVSIPVAFVNVSWAKYLWLGGSLLVGLAFRAARLVARRRADATG